MKIVISNTVILNGGDCAILYSLMDLMRKVFGEETEFVVYDSAAETAGRYYPGIRFREMLFNRYRNSSRRNTYLRFIPQWFTLIRVYLGAWFWSHRLGFLSNIVLSEDELEDMAIYHSADLIVSTGGTYLIEDYSLRPRIFDFNISLILKKPLLLFTQSLGPFHRGSHRRKLKKIFNKTLLIFVRDKVSYQHLEDLQVDLSKVHIFPDVVFLSSAESPEHGESRDANGQRVALQVAISVRHWKHFKKTDKSRGMANYIEVVRQIVVHLIRKHGAYITFISTCQGIPEYFHDDSITAAEIYDGLPDDTKDRVQVDSNFHMPDDLICFLASVDMVISTRMHMAIMALVSGTPVLPIAYEFKTLELFKQLGLEKWVLDIETISSGNAIALIDTFLVKRQNMHPDITKSILYKRNLVLESGIKVKEEFLKVIRNPRAK
jgi:colanic acid/amylovoran biosynthesis protein